MSGAATSEHALARLYDALARYNELLRRLRRDAPGHGLEMRKRLGAPRGDGPAAGPNGLDAWILDVLAPEPDARVLDVGCGFGATLFAWARRNPAGTQVGWSLSPYQIRVARREATRLGLAARCRFDVASFDAERARAEDDPRFGAPFDALVSIESLFHSPDLERTSARLATLVRPGGRIALVEDMATDKEVEATPDGAELRRTWATPRLHARGAFARALDGAGFEVEREVDLTGQVERVAPERLSTSRRRLARMRRLAPFGAARAVADAYLGGLALERLYGAGRMRYVALFAARRPER